MISFVLVLVQFFYPVTNAYAAQVKKDVVISVTYTEVVPISVCTYAYSPEDVDMREPFGSHCWAPKSPIGDLDVWKDERLDMVNFKVVVKYPKDTVTIILAFRINS